MRVVIERVRDDSWVPLLVWRGPTWFVQRLQVLAPRPSEEIARKAVVDVLFRRLLQRGGGAADEGSVRLSELRTEWDSGVVRFHGVLDRRAGPDFAGLRVVADAGVEVPLVVDLAGVERVDLAGLVLLADLARRPNVTIENVPGPDRFSFDHP